MTIRVSNINGKSYTAGTTFQVYKPDFGTEVLMGTPTVSQNPLGVGLYPTPNSGQTHGITWRAYVDVPENFSYGGEWAFAQLITENEHFTAASDGAGYHMHLNGVRALDLQFPYGSTFQSNSGWQEDGDTPHAVINPAGIDHISLNDNFETWLMFKPDGGSWVPLAKTTWGINVGATSNGTTLTLDAGAWATPNPYFVPTTQYPEWTVVKDIGVTDLDEPDNS